MKNELLSSNISPLLDQIRSIPILTRGEERALALKVRAGIDAKNLLNTSSSVPQKLQLLSIMETGMVAKNKFVTSNMLLVVSIAKKYYRRDVDLMELIQEGVFGLIRAAEKFDPERGVKFSTYATNWVSVFIYKYISKTVGLLYVPTHASQNLNKYCKLYDELNIPESEVGDDVFEAMGVEAMGEKDFKSAEDLYKVTQTMFSLHETIRGSEFIFEDLILEEETENPEDAIILKLDTQTAINNTLNDDEKFVIYRRFGINGLDINTITEIAEAMNEMGIKTTKDKVRKIEKVALTKLKEYFVNVNYEEF